MRPRHLLPLFALPLFALSCADLTSTAPAYVHESNELEGSAGPAAMTNKTDTSESALVGRFRSIPDTHNGVLEFPLEFYFNEEPVGLSYTTVRDHLFDVTNGRVVRARRVTPGSNLEWELTVAPDSLDVIELTNRTTASCEDDYAVCTVDGKRLMGTATAQVQPLVPTTSLPLTATFADLPDSHDGATPFTFQLRFSEEPVRLSHVWVQLLLLRVTNGRITAARRVTKGSNLAFFVTVQPSAASDISLTVVGTTDCDAQYAVCTVDGRMLVGGTSATVDVAEPPPNLGVGPPSVSDASPATGGSFTLSATVSNAGDGASVATTLRYRRSEDTTITSSDTQVGTDTVGALASGEASDQSVDLTAPLTAGAYYYGACVDAATTDNCSASVKVDVVEPPPSVPLTATFADLPDTHDGATAFTFQLRFSEEPADLSYVTVRDALLNVTNGSITDAGRATKGSNLAFIVTVQPSAGSDISLTVNGTADCDAQHAVCTVDGRMLAGGTSATVDMVEQPPNLGVGPPSVSDASPATGGSFTLSATVSNTGDGASVATTLRYRRSEDAMITSSDTQVGTDAVGALASGGASDQSVDLTAPSTAGAYYYGACVDEVAGESDTTDNCSASVKVDIRDPSAEHFDIDLLFTSNVNSTTRAAIEAVRDILEAIVWSTELTDIQMPATVECGRVSVDDVGVVDDIAVLFDVRYISGIGSQRDCYRTTEHDFPVFSLITLHQGEIGTLTDEEFEHLVLHELLHALGFSSTTFNNLDLVATRNGYPYFTGDSAVAAWVAAGGTEYYPDKVPLLPNDYHWQVIFFDDEIMGPLEGGILSAITLQALADMGYTVDLGFAEAFTVPKNAYNQARDNQAQDGFRRILDMSNDVLSQPVTVLDRYGTPVRVIQPPPGTIRRLRPRQEVWHDSPQT